MSIRKRKRIGKSLLIAGAGVSLTMTGACMGVSGNLVPPPRVQLCIEVEPETADVLVAGISVEDGGCLDVYQGGNLMISATAEGYQDYDEELVVEEATTHNIDMIPEDEDTAGGIDD